ncbi:hypothetical protein ERJ75_000450200 [Trypanosoma vivax]|nr:hypothetical protein ERJ75_000450200 [Trypanosoma vivax]
MVMERNNFSLGQQIATNATELIVKTWWNKNTSFLIQNLQTLINESSDICSKHAENMKQQSWISRYTNRTYSDVIRLASSGRSDLVKYMETVGSVDGLDGRHRNVSASLVKLLPTGNVSRIINATARDIVELQEIKTQLQKEKVRYVVMVQRREKRRGWVAAPACGSSSSRSLGGNELITRSCSEGVMRLFYIYLMHCEWMMLRQLFMCSNT